MRGQFILIVVGAMIIIMAQRLHNRLGWVVKPVYIITPGGNGEGVAHMSDC